MELSKEDLKTILEIIEIVEVPRPKGYPTFHITDSKEGDDILQEKVSRIKKIIGNG